MKQFLEFAPILAFFITYYVGERDLLAATGVLIVAQTVLTAGLYLRYRKLDRPMQIQFWAVVLLGGLTLALNNVAFIQWRPTLVNWILAAGLALSQIFGERNLLERMLGGQLPLPRRAWNHLAWGWCAAFFFAGALNLVVVFQFSEEFWVNYKLFGGFALTLCYVIATVVYLARSGHLDEQPEPAPAAVGAASAANEAGETETKDGSDRP
ncbi:MAG: septation protein IspZ [Gammaproteobacteria bacterium]|nr:septation protein IspZ [Gammaproteobacteria bacterium]